MASDLTGNDEQVDLLLKIARCPIADRCLNGDVDHSCAKIVRSQGVNSASQFQSPEPWSGQLNRAPILFLSSNPSIGPATFDQYPRSTWEDESITEYFEYRFGGKPLSPVEQGIYHASPGTTKARRGIPFWIQVRARAAELLGKTTNQVVAGTDYALTEVVRCKSKDEYGVAESLPTCVGEYLEPTLAASVASVIVVLGSPAKRAICNRYDLAPDVHLHGPLMVANRQRMIVFLPHPTGRAPRKTFNGCLLLSDLDRLRMWMDSIVIHQPG
jgi:hypothetical protein